MDLINAKYLEDYKILLTFENQKSGVVDFADYSNRKGLFSKFRNIDFFKNFSVNTDIGTICWEDGLDIAPEILYHKATGEPFPDWIDT
jgi:hypothetical protein